MYLFKKKPDGKSYINLTFNNRKTTCMFFIQIKIEHQGS